MVLGAQALAEGSLGEGRRAVRLPPLLPCNTFQIDTRLSLADARTELSKHLIDPKEFDIRMDSIPTVFVGRATELGFRMHRLAGYANSFMPLIIGEFQQTSQGVSVCVHMRLDNFMLVFTSVWFGSFVLVGGAVILILHTLAPVELFAFAYILVMASFWIEASRQERALRAIFGDDA